MAETELSTPDLINSAPEGLARTSAPAIAWYDFDPQEILITNFPLKRLPSHLRIYENYKAKSHDSRSFQVSAKEVLETALETTINIYDYGGNWYFSLFDNMGKFLDLTTKFHWSLFEEYLYVAASHRDVFKGNLYETGYIIEKSDGKFTTLTVSLPWRPHGTPFYQRLCPEKPYIWTAGAVAILGIFLDFIGIQPDPGYIETPLDRLRRKKIREALEAEGQWWGQVLSQKRHWDLNPSYKWRFDTRVLKMLAKYSDSLKDAKDIRRYFVTANQQSIGSFNIFEPRLFLDDINYLNVDSDI